jgi:hypothetical protein
MPATTVEAKASQGEEPEKTLVMEPVAAPSAAEEPDELSIDCSSFDAIALEPAAKDSPVVRVDDRSDNPGDAPVELMRSRRLLVCSGLVGGALMIALAIAHIPIPVSQEPAAPPELGAGAAEEPSPPSAASPSEDTASARRNAPAPAAKALGPTQRAAIKPPPAKTPWPAKGAKKPSGQKQGQGGQRPPSQGAAAQSSTSMVPTAESKDDSPPSAVFGVPRETTSTH